MGQYRSTAANPLEERVDVTSNTLTIAASHVDKTIYAGGSGAQTYTLPSEAVDATIEVGARIRVVRDANQTLTFDEGADLFPRVLAGGDVGEMMDNGRNLTVDALF